MSSGIGVPTGHVVVTFGSASPDWCDMSHCPVQAFGPFETEEAAKSYIDQQRMPEWQRPHVLLLVTSEAG